MTTQEEPMRIRYDPLDDTTSRLELISCTDLIDKTTFTADQMPLLSARISTLREGKTGENKDKDMHLMSDTLAQNKHMTPFEHLTVTFRVVAPIFVVREWQRHRTQSYNEMSMRYVRAEDQNSKIFRFYEPHQWRKQSKGNKQGSAEIITDDVAETQCILLTRGMYDAATVNYLALAKLGVASELCRMVLPVATYTEMYATANLRNWYAFYELRADEAAQWEIRQYALVIGKILSELFPDTWKALSKWKSTGLSNEELNTLIDLCTQKIPLQATVEGKKHLTDMKAKLEKLLRRP